MINTESTPRIILTAKEFTAVLKGGYIGVKEEDGKGYYEGGSAAVTFSNIEVIEHLRIENSKGLSSISINHSSIRYFSIIKSDIIFIKIETSTIDNFWVGNSSINSIEVSNSKSRGCTLEDSKFNIFQATTLEIDYFDINNSTLNSLIIAHSTTNQLRLNDSKITGIGISLKSKTEDIFLRKTEITNFNIGESTTGKIRVSDNSIVGNFHFNPSSIIKGVLSIEDSKLNKIKIEAKELRKIEIQVSFIQNFIWEQDSFCLLNLDTCTIVVLEFRQAIIPKDSVFQISNSSINSVDFSQFVNTGWLNISSLKPLNSYDRFLEEATINRRVFLTFQSHRFEPVANKKSRLILINSDLGRTSFVNCDLTAFDEFVFFNTKMLEVFVAGTKLPTKVTLPHEPEIEQPAQERLAFSQFKKIADNRGDNVQATEFLALEMDAYAKQITDEKGKCGEKINLWLNKFSSNWGNDWVRAVLVTFAVNSYLFMFYCLSLGYTLGKDWGLFWNLFSYSFEFLNPLRKADFLKSDINSLINPSKNPLEITSCARIIDYLSRIIVAYFTYQTIQAFRRFGKK